MPRSSSTSSCCESDYSVFSPFSSPGKSPLSSSNQSLFNTASPYLHIVKEPKTFQIFRYQKEKRGSKTSAIVELRYYDDPAEITCELVHFDIDMEHPHWLERGEQKGYITSNVPTLSRDGQMVYCVRFSDMKILHATKDNVRQFMETRLDWDPRHTDRKHKHTVRLKFSARDLSGNLICDPVFSKPIKNNKSAKTKPLNIARSSELIGKSEGGQSIYLFVDTVSKDDIRVRLYDGVDWEAVVVPKYVHFQHAIEFLTPPYTAPCTSKIKKVKMQLLRPSDGATSNSRVFIYSISPEHRQAGPADCASDSEPMVEGPPALLDEAPAQVPHRVRLPSISTIKHEGSTPEKPPALGQRNLLATSGMTSSSSHSCLPPTREMASASVRSYDTPSPEMTPVFGYSNLSLTTVVVPMSGHSYWRYTPETSPALSPSNLPPTPETAPVLSPSNSPLTPEISPWSGHSNLRPTAEITPVSGHRDLPPTTEMVHESGHSYYLSTLETLGQSSLPPTSEMVFALGQSCVQPATEMALVSSQNYVRPTLEMAPTAGQCYLPPTSSQSYFAPSPETPPAPSQSYFAPTPESPPAPSQRYFTPSLEMPPAPSQSYFTPSLETPPALSQSYFAPTSETPPAPSQSYFTPSLETPPALSQSYFAPTSETPPAPSQSYFPPIPEIERVPGVSYRPRTPDSPLGSLINEEYIRLQTVIYEVDAETDFDDIAVPTLCSTECQNQSDYNDIDWDDLYGGFSDMVPDSGREKIYLKKHKEYATAQSAGYRKSAENIKSTEDIKSTETIKSREDIASIKDIRSTEDIESPENIKSIEDIKSTETIKSTEDIKSTEEIKSTEDIRSIKDIRSTEDVKVPENIKPTGDINKHNDEYEITNNDHQSDENLLEFDDAEDNQTAIEYEDTGLQRVEVQGYKISLLCLLKKWEDYVASQSFLRVLQKVGAYLVLLLYVIFQ